MPTRTPRNIIALLLLALLTLTLGCTKPDRSEEAKQLKDELQGLLFKNPEQALARVDSAEQAGVFSTAMANLIRTNIYGTMGQTRLAVFYGEQILNDTELTLAKFRFYVEGEATPEPAVNPGPGDNPDPKPQAKPFEAYAGSPGITYCGYDKAVDGNMNTSWETKLEHKSNGVWFVEFRSREPLEVKGYTIWSKDYTPWKFKLYGKLSEKEQWILLSNKEIYEDYDWYPREIPIENIIPTFRYQYFRFEVSEQWHPEGPSYYDRIIIEELIVHE